ncbi:hypothetical protein H2201_008396 [Coniosporium apollinis]|uniref:Uncharacterized protein n=1 Tax=Coniosporium apollinis TaxID=61459 RepID=A0ABQ9NGV9_9PEZI|nr:hypothetical protein H2201_008396 [Coniosporium apollinis]
MSISSFSSDRYLLDLHTHTQTQAENDVYNRTIHINHLVRYYGHSDWTSVPALEDSDLSMHDFNEVLHGPRGGKFILRQWVMFGEGERAFEVCRRGGRRVYVSVEVAIVKGLEEDRRRVEGVNGVGVALWGVMRRAMRMERGKGGTRWLDRAFRSDSVSIPPPTPSSASSSPSNGARVPSKTPPKQADKVPMPQPLPFQKPNPSISPKELNAFAVSQLTARSGPGAGAKSSRKMDPKVSWEERYRTRARKYA